MPVAQSAALVQMLRRLRLLNTAQLGEVESTLGGEFPDPKQLVAELARRSWLTRYQADELLAGRGNLLLLGSYVLVAPVGEGGMGQVFKARQWKLERIVAVKVIHQERLGSADAARRFQREIRAAAQLDHPNIVRAIDADEIEGRHLFVMEYVEGVDLSTVVKQNGPLPVAVACECIRQAALGLQHAFEHGMVHRDIKPGNLLLTTNAGGVPVVKLMDMGLVRMDRAMSETSLNSSLTSEGSVMGTPDYIAPEQALEAHGVDIRADLYSLGCTFYYLLTGRVPFPGGTLMQKLMKHRLEQPTPVESLEPRVPPGVAAIVRRLMAKTPEQRYQTPAELAAALADPSRAAEATVVAALAQPQATTTSDVNPFAELGSGDTMQPTPTPRSRSAIRKPPSSPLPLVAAVVSVASVLLIALLAMIARSAFSSKPETSEAKAAASSPAGGPKPLPKAARDDAAEKEKKRRADAEKQRRADAERELTLLTPRVDAARPADFPTLEAEVRKFLSKHSGTSAATSACVVLARMLPKIPSPLDQLDAMKLPASAGVAWQTVAGGVPADLVGVLGDDRGRHQGLAAWVTRNRDGTILASAGVDGVRLWDAKTMAPRGVLGGPGLSTQTIAFAADDTLLCAIGTELRRWDVSGAQPKDLGAIKEVGPAVRIALSSDGKLLATSGPDQALYLWEFGSSPRKRATLAVHPEPLNSFAFSRDGRMLASGCHDKKVRLWDLTPAEPRLVAELTGHGDWVYQVAFSPDGKTLASAGAHDRTFRLWDLSEPTPKARATLPVPNTATTSVAFSDDGKTMFGGLWSGEILLWDLTVFAAPTAARGRHSDQVWCIAPDGEGATIATAASDGAVRLWNARTWADLHPSTGLPGAATSVAFSQDGKRLIGGGNGEARVWDLPDGKLAATLGPIAGPVRFAALLPSGLQAVTSGDKLRTWDLIRQQMSGPEGEVANVGAVSPDGTRVAISDTTQIIVWDVTNGLRPNDLLAGHDNNVNTIAFALDGKRLASAGNDHRTRVWDLTGQGRRETAVLGEGIAGGGPSNTCAAFTPDGRQVAVGVSGGKIRVFDVSDVASREVAAVEGLNGNALCLAFSPDGRWMAFATDSWHVEVWEFVARRRHAAWKMPGLVAALAFAPDGRHLATANANGTAYIIRVPAAPRALGGDGVKRP
jgi:WD40 repeat protein/serine/threonine protein kinase